MRMTYTSNFPGATVKAVELLVFDEGPSFGNKEITIYFNNCFTDTSKTKKTKIVEQLQTQLEFAVTLGLIPSSCVKFDDSKQTLKLSFDKKDTWKLAPFLFLLKPIILQKHLNWLVELEKFKEHEKILIKSSWLSEGDIYLIHNLKNNELNNGEIKNALFHFEVDFTVFSKNKASRNFWLMIVGNHLLLNGFNKSALECYKEVTAKEKDDPKLKKLYQIAQFQMGNIIFAMEPSKKNYPKRDHAKAAFIHFFNAGNCLDAPRFKQKLFNAMCYNSYSPTLPDVKMESDWTLEQCLTAANNIYFGKKAKLRSEIFSKKDFSKRERKSSIEEGKNTPPSKKL